MSVHEMVAEKVQLAGVYAEDGAYRSAARLLRAAAEIYDRHASRVDRQLARLMTGADA